MTTDLVHHINYRAGLLGEALILIEGGVRLYLGHAHLLWGKSLEKICREIPIGITVLPTKA